MAHDADASGPLEGVRVLDFTTMLSGPFCTMLLADLGADVIKVEAPAGDSARRFGPFLPDDTQRHYGAYFQSINRNKRSIVLDLSTAAGAATALALVDTVEVVVENFRPGVMERFGLGWEVLSARSPKLVYAAIRGFGDPRTGETAKADWPAFDLVAQALGGFMSITGSDAAHPMKSGPGIGDIFPAALASTGLLAALLRAERTGRGSFVDVAMYDAMIALCERIIYQYSYESIVPRPQGNTHPLLCPFDVFAAVDGWVAITAPYDHQWLALRHLLGLDDARFDTLGERNAHAAQVRGLISTWAGTRTKAQIVDVLGGLVPCAPVNTAADIFADPDVAVRDMLCSVAHPGSASSGVIAGSAIKILGRRTDAVRPAPRLGEHTDAVLGEIAVGPGMSPNGAVR